jgi:hypothetical protein
MSAARLGLGPFDTEGVANVGTAGVSLVRWGDPEPVGGQAMMEGKFLEPKLSRREDGNLVLEPPYEIPWADVMVNSREFGLLPIHERFRQLAHGYLASGKSLAVELGEHPDRLNWPRAAVACFYFYHAVELFVKACILYRSPNDKIAHHDVTELKIRYHELYPCDKYFAFQCLWDLRLKDIERAAGVKPSGNYFDGKSDQLFRYLADKEGNPPNGLYNFPPGLWLKTMEDFEEAMNRIWGNVLEAYPPAPATTD